MFSYFIYIFISYKNKKLFLKNSNNVDINLEQKMEIIYHKKHYLFIYL